MQSRLVGALAVLLSPFFLLGQTANPIVRFETNLGNIDVELLPGSAPLTVANFLKYMDRGSYNRSFFHRSVPTFIIQGGGFQWTGRTAEIPADAPVRNEYSLSNIRGTIAMAKLGSDPNSATTQWFFNLNDTNAANLNNQNGGFTVFGRIANAAGLAVMDRIAAVRVYNAGSPFDQLPLVNFTTGSVTEQNLVLVRSVARVQDTPAPSISAGGVITASTFGGAASAAPGSFIEIYGTNLAGSTSRAWTGSDFTNGNAPVSLEDVTATVDGRPAYVNYVSASQVNVQVPADVATSGTVPVVVSYRGQASAAVSLAMRPLAGALLAPPDFKAGDRQYVGAFHANGTPVGNGSVPSANAVPARPGEEIVIYGVGFGPVTPSSTPVAGQIPQGATALTTPVEFRIGDTAAQRQYAGLAPGLVGVYQFNVTIPLNARAGDLPVQVVLGGEALPQTLFINVQAP